MPDVKTLPLTASVEMPTSSLAVLPKLIPQVTRVDGTIAISMQATGTINEPKLSGHITADARFIRMANGSIPPISILGARLALAGNTVTVQRFDGETGGGRFSIGGNIVAKNLLEPIVDLRVRTDKVLAMRNDSVLVRVDTDVTLRGPFHAGTASGRLVLAQSRFNKEIQILPILMPGRPKPVPREVAQPTVISFPNPPLRDWKFDIVIVTTEDDPFLVRGNLAKGRVRVDMRLQGTGIAPYLTGTASMEQFTAQLPVSRLTTRRGVINFSQENPFEPRLEIESETVIRGYTIIARLEGPASSPRLDLSSEPPLPQQEIMTLLTTGSLQGELGENSSALATRAGLMVLRDLYKKVFKHDLPVPSDTGGDNFFERFSVDLGAVDSRTGRQEITGQFRVTDRVVIVGDIEMGGGVSGRIQYLFRFR
jgi:autotransporter translocation and assembly factor TamB